MLDKALSLDMIRKNVAKDCELPMVEKTEMHTLSDVELRQFLEIAKDDPFYLMYYVDFFTGLRESELIGLTWDCIDFEQGTIRVYRQFVRIASGPGKGKMMYTSLKNHKERTIHPAPSVMEALRQAKKKQAEQRLRAGSAWNNEYDMVFTRDNGKFVRFKTLYIHFKDLVSRINRPEMRFHDIRHTYATLSIQSEIDFKTLSLSLGHATVAFTLDTYGHVSNRMSQNAVDKMERLICSL